MTENNVSYNRILKMLMDFGIFMIRCGAEINRVEDTVSRLGMSYPISNVSVFAITTSLPQDLKASVSRVKSFFSGITLEAIPCSSANTL